MKRLLLLSILLLVPVLRAQDQSQSATSPPSASKSAGGFRTQMQKDASGWARAFNSKDVDKVGDMYADDAVYVNEEGAFHGRDDIKSQLKKQMDRGDRVLSIAVTKAVRGGDLGYAEGTWASRVAKEGGGQQSVRGFWVVTVKNVEGKWLAVTDTAIQAGAKK